MSGQTAKTAAHRDVLTNLVMLALIVVLVALGAAYGIDALSRASASSAADDRPELRVPVNVAGVALEVPETAIRSGHQPGSAFADRLDLRITLSLAEDTAIPLDLTLVPKARARASAALLDSVYLSHFTAEEKRGVPGLIGKPLKGGDGYDGETVWYDPISIDPFTAKCAPPIAEGYDGDCMQVLVLDSGLSAILGFPEAALKHWRLFDAPLLAVLKDLGAGTPVR